MVALWGNVHFVQKHIEKIFQASRVLDLPIDRSLEIIYGKNYQHKTVEHNNQFQITFDEDNYREIVAKFHDVYGAHVQTTDLGMLHTVFTQAKD